ncbi:glutaminyl-peptide cyclotransferase [Wenyingzhuangia sp. IMCC45533]
MQLNRFLAIIILVISLSSCQKTPEFDLKTPKKIKINQELVITTSGDDLGDLKTEYFIDDQLVGSGKEIKINIENYKLGKHNISVRTGEMDDTISKEQTVVFLAPAAPKVYSYKVVNRFPHDRTSFTQGLEFHNNFLYEGTGKNGKSVLRKTELKTGEILQEQALAKKYFGEGITIFNDKIYQLTWLNKIGFIYDVNTFKTLKTFAYKKSVQGWGLTHNDTHLIKSDGTENLWFLDPKDGSEKEYIEVYTNKKKIDKLNELEYINGKIYANVWTINAIAIINPSNGAVEAIINMKGLANQLDNKTIAGSSDKVLNGIAYDAATNQLYVTGKNWDKIFEIEIIK